MNEEALYAMALTRIIGFNHIAAIQLYRKAGSAKAVYEHRNDIRDLMPDLTPHFVVTLKDWSEAMRKAEGEMIFLSSNRIEALTPSDPLYPTRLTECADAPLLLYYKGKADLNRQHIVSIVGTRHCTTYGNDLARRFIADMKRLCPDVLIVSGLAYGVDVCAHQYSLDQKIDTVGVLAHGLDTIYPSAHRGVAEQMLSQGGLLTEYMTQCRIDKMNFVRRNRIVAGMSDATIVIESAKQGGSLITASIALDYGRDVYAFPGAVGAPYSEGCNLLIQKNAAGLITSAEDFMNAIGWHTCQERPQAIERQLFPELTPEEQKVVDVLQETNDLQINVISVKMSIPIGKVSAILFNLEMKGVVRPLAGGIYHLLS